MYINNGRNFEVFPVFETVEEVEAFAIQFIQWLHSIAPPSCVNGIGAPRALPYVPLKRISIEDGSAEDNIAWQTICLSGANGALLLGLCLWIWKRDGGDRFSSSHLDYLSVLKDLHWIIDGGIRVGKDYFSADT